MRQIIFVVWRFVLPSVIQITIKLSQWISDSFRIDCATHGHNSKERCVFFSTSVDVCCQLFLSTLSDKLFNLIKTNWIHDNEFLGLCALRVVWKYKMKNKFSLLNVRSMVDVHWIYHKIVFNENLNCVLNSRTFW